MQYERYGQFDTKILVDKCIDKDPIAWAEFVKRFSPFLVFSIQKALKKYTNAQQVSKADVDDIHQTMLVALWNKDKLKEIKNKGNINYWLAIVSRNTTINYLKQKRKEILVSDTSYFENLPFYAEKSDIDAKEKIEKMKARLNSKEKLLFVLHFEKGLNFKDIAKMVNVPLGTATSIISRIRKKMAPKGV